MKIVSEDLNFKGKRVLITGAASGIGAAMAKTFSDHGASLILADINKMDPNYNKKRIPSLLQTIEFDQADPRSIERMVAQAGRVDILLNNAGIVWMGQFEKMSEADISKLFAINLSGHIQGAQ